MCPRATRHRGSARSCAGALPTGSIWVPAAGTQTDVSLGAERANAHSAHGCATDTVLSRDGCAGRPDGAGEPLRPWLYPRAGRFVPVQHKAQQGLWLRAPVGRLRREVEASLGRHCSEASASPGRDGDSLLLEQCQHLEEQVAGRRASGTRGSRPMGPALFLTPFPTGAAWGCVRAGSARWVVSAGTQGVVSL